MTLAAAPQIILSYYDFDTGQVQSGVPMALGHNLNFNTYFDPGRMFIDQLKLSNITTNPDAAPGTLVNGYLDASTSGSGSNICFSTGRPWNNEEGVYVLTWEGAGVEANFQGGTLTQDNYPGENRREYTWLEQSDSNIWVGYTGGLPTRVSLIAPDQEARFDAGNIMHSTYISDVAGIRVMRAMDLMETNSSWLTDATDLTPYENANWREQQANISPRPQMGCSIQAVAEAANEIDCDLWFCVPPKATNACATAIFDLLETYLDAGREVYIEYGNEYWNSASAFLDFYNWITYGDVSVEVAALNPVDGLCTLNGHGFNSADEVACFTSAVHSNWPYAKGAVGYVDLVDINTFFLSFDSGDLAGTRFGPPPQLYDTTVNFKRTALSAKSNDVNYAERSMALWALADTSFATRTVHHVGAGQAANVNRINGQLPVAGYREAMDWFAIAPYFRANTDPSFPDQSFASMTDTVLTGADSVITSGYVNNHINVLGSYRLITYEGGDHSIENGTQTAKDKLLGWQRSSEAGRCYDGHFKNMATLGIPLFCNYNTTSTYSATGGSWGVMEHLGDKDAAEYLGIEPFLDNNGEVPKN